jgi:hypothetical protein
MIRRNAILCVCCGITALLAACASQPEPTDSPSTVAAKTMEIILTEISEQIWQSQTMAPSPTSSNTPTLANTDTPTIIPTVDLGVTTPLSGITPVLSTPTGPTPTTDPNSLLTRTLVGKCNAAFFIDDIGPIQDNTKVKAGATFTKTWDVRNIGFCTWNRSYRLSYFSGQHMFGADYIDFPEIVPPNKNIWLSVTLTAPKSTGSHIGRWYLRDPEGDRFGVGLDGDEPLIVRITVVA